jgi:protein-S-isoprenylcysteine O-methyltransferase Ste14
MMVSIGNFLFHWRNALFPLAVLLVLLPGVPVLADPLVAAALGGLVALAGQSVRAITIGYEYIVRGGKDRRVYAENLVTEGFYRLCRNPMYVGNLLIYSGLTVASNSWTCVIVGVPLFVFVYAAIVAAEEAYLRGRFGAAYDAYAADVPRWLPRLGSLGDALRSGRFHWRRLLAKEYGTPFGWISVLFVVSLFHLWRAGRLQAAEGPVVPICTAFALVTVLYAIVRILKKTRRLVAD